jgi:hypothetical protein
MSRKYSGFFASQKSAGRCDDLLTGPLTTPIGRAYNPATERGAALAHRPRHVFAPVKLLFLMSEVTTDTNRLSFAVETGFYGPPS